MICIHADITQSICDIDDERKPRYHNTDTVSIWVFKTRNDRKKFVDDTAGVLKSERENHYEEHFT